MHSDTILAAILDLHTVKPILDIPGGLECIPYPYKHSIIHQNHYSILQSSGDIVLQTYTVHSDTILAATLDLHAVSNPRHSWWLGVYSLYP